MVLFHPSIIEAWRATGYKFIQVLPLKKYGVLRPLFRELEVNKGYVIDISEIGLLQLTEDYFLIKEKDAPSPILVKRNFGR